MKRSEEECYGDQKKSDGMSMLGYEPKSGMKETGSEYSGGSEVEFCIC